MESKIFKRKAVSTVLACCMALSGLAATVFSTNAATSDSSVSAVASDSVSASQGPQSKIQGANILHCFNWSYNTIKSNLATIKNAGYTAVQTSPVQTPKDFNASWKDTDGQWWKLYQPIDIAVADKGQTWLGSKAELQALCTEADKYGIKVIVDIVANHMANINGTGNHMDDIHTSVSSVLRNNSSYWHINNIWADDSSRYNMTQGSIGEPDLNTGNSYIQGRFKDLLVELVDLGVDGFRFDAAKHIELPTDSGCASQFWPTVLNAAKAKNSNVFFYGEILGSTATSISNYTKYMSVTDCYAGDRSLVAANNKNASELANANYSNGANATYNVLWAESHDTYMGESGSAGLRNTSGVSSSTVTKTWAIVGARANSSALFFARPATTMGSVSTDTSWKSTAVAEVNKFKNYFAGTTEYLASSGDVAYVERGTSGVVLTKLGGSGSVSVTANKMASGTYKDQVSGSTFTVSGGKISGTIGSTGVAVVYNVSTTPTTPTTVKPTTAPVTTVKPTTVPATTVKPTTAPATTVKPTTAPVTTVPAKVILVGDVNLNSSITVDDATLLQKYIAELSTLSDDALSAADVNADENADIKDVTAIQCYNAGFTSKSGNCGKNVGDSDDVPGYYRMKFTNSLSWSGTISCYYWSDSNTGMVAWPGKAMTYEGTNSAGKKVYSLLIPDDAQYVIFTNGSKQTVDIPISSGGSYSPVKLDGTGKYTVNKG